MIQLDLEQRQSSRFIRPFLATDHEDESFSLAFEGGDVNLTGIGFWVPDADLFIPQQVLSLRIKNQKTQESYVLESVEVVYIREIDGQYFCGCHISQVTSEQLLAHHRLVMTDEATALVSMEDTALSEFDFMEEGSKLSTDEADFQEASMALNLAVAQAEINQKNILDFIDSTDRVFDLPLPAAARLMELKEDFNRFKTYLNQINDTTVAFATLAKLLAHTPEDLKNRQAWQTLISDFETRFLTEQQQVAYDFMHQGMEAKEALKLAAEYLSNHPEEA